MQNGISIYAGLDCGLEENLALMESAAALGMSKIFTSAQIPEFDGTGKFFDDFATLLAAGVENGFEIILDVNADNFAEYDIDGLTLRLDDGFTPERIADISKRRKIHINASTATREFLAALVGAGADFANISAMHNFYPHPYTGLDAYFFENQNRILHEFGLEVGAFVGSRDGKRRPPLGEGLPTLEDCRNFSADLAARFLAALETDFIIIGDGLPTQEELAAVAKVESDEVVMTAELLTQNPVCAELLSGKFTRRPDVAKSVVRAVESRQMLKTIGGTIAPEISDVERSFGDVTLDNENFGRYAGELQIVGDVLPADPRVNIVARIVPEEIFLTGYIKPGQKFSFKLI